MKRLWVLALLTIFVMGCASNRNTFDERILYQSDNITVKTVDKAEEPELIIAGQDVVLDILANYLQQEGVNTARTYLNSFEGLLSLYQDNIQVAACHLFDGFDYNTSYVRSLMPGMPERR